jgi:hypothetical protein
MPFLSKTYCYQGFQQGVVTQIDLGIDLKLFQINAFPYAPLCASMGQILQLGAKYYVNPSHANGYSRLVN